MSSTHIIFNKNEFYMINLFKILFTNVEPNSRDFVLNDPDPRRPKVHRTFCTWLKWGSFWALHVEPTRFTYMNECMCLPRTYASLLTPNAIHLLIIMVSENWTNSPIRYSQLQYFQVRIYALYTYRFNLIHLPLSKSNFSSNLHKISFIILLYILTDHEPVWIFYPMCGFFSRTYENNLWHYS